MRIAVREYGITCIRIIPMFTGIAIDDKLAFYPLYTAACDEGAVVSINIGCARSDETGQTATHHPHRRSGTGLSGAQTGDEPSR